MIKKINIAEKFDLFDEIWVPKIAAELNNDYVKLDKFHGEFLWHKHDDEDELFLVVKGDIVVKFRDGDVHVSEGEFIVIPKGVEHKPTAEKVAHVLIVEPKNALNTGDVQDEMTLPDLDWV
jgi:mannose-6-phosphate isomerase-like protein (cupin superfamily)